MATVRGSVIGTNHKHWKLIINLHDNGGVIVTEWPADLYISTGAAVDIQNDGALIYPAASSSTNEGFENAARKRKRVVTSKEVFEGASERKESTEIACGRNKRESFKDKEALPLWADDPEV